MLMEIIVEDHSLVHCTTSTIATTIHVLVVYCIDCEHGLFHIAGEFSVQRSQAEIKSN